MAYTLKVQLSEGQKEALDALIKREKDRSPLLPPNQSDILRRMIVMAAFACPQCDEITIPHPDKKMVGARYCTKCDEPVSFDVS